MKLSQEQRKAIGDIIGDAIEEALLDIMPPDISDEALDASPADPYPWLTKMIEFEGLDEVDDNDKLKAFLGIDPEEVPWCAAIVTKCLEVSGKPALGLRARDYATYGEEGNGSIGDIAVWRSHLGIVASETEVIGGNVSNECKRSPHPHTGKDWFRNFMGFRKVV